MTTVSGSSGQESDPLNLHEFEIPTSFLQYAEAAIVRLEYLFPDLVFRIAGSRLSVINNAEEEVEESQIRKLLFHQLYREKIRAETGPIRSWFYRLDE